MCRLAAYVGPPKALSSLIYDPPHGLERQAYLPRQMLSGHVNVDGSGVAWWAGDEEAPLLYVTEQPPWSDANLPGLAPRLVGAPILAVVRSQTEGMPAGSGAAHPFVLDRWAGAHNGYLANFEVIAADLIASLDADLVGRLGTVTDSRVLFLLAVGALRRGASLQDAVVDAAAAALKSYGSDGGVASLNLVVADRNQVVALRLARGVEANSLHVLDDRGSWPGGRVLASEPLDDDPGWAPVAADSMVTLTAGEVVVEDVTV